MWRVGIAERVLPRLLSRGFSQSSPPIDFARVQKKAPRQKSGPRQPRQPRTSFSRPKNSKAVLCVRGSSVFYSLKKFEERDSQSTMGKKKNKNKLPREDAPPPDNRYPLRSKDPAHQSFSSTGFNQPSPEWLAMMGNLGPNSFNSPMPHMFNGPNPFNMVTAQPGFFNGMQSMSMPFLTPNMFMGGGLVPPGSLAPAGSPPNIATPPPNAEVNPSPKPAGGRAAISAPSAESGGVPEPTPAYLMRASFMPKRRDHPGPLLVVIDLNGTVLHRPDRRHGARFEARQHAQPFVTYCVETFWVVIWSSARPDNVRRMVDQLLTPAARREVIAVWGRDRFGLTEADYNARTQCYKRLTTLWADPLVRSAYPRTRAGFEGGCWNQGNTVLIDDSAEKARGEPHNAITLPEFTGGADVAADVLPRVHDYLNELCYQEDVSAYMRANPFKMA